MKTKDFLLKKSIVFERDTNRIVLRFGIIRLIQIKSKKQP